MRNLSRPIHWLAGAALVCAASFSCAGVAPELAAAIAGPQRTPANSARDVWRHPAETLTFFGIRADMTVAEISPGGGWYTEILAPYLRDKGRLYAAAYVKDMTGEDGEYFRKGRLAFEAKLAAQPAVYDKVVITDFHVPDRLVLAPAGSADAVLTFRNIHNWLRDGADGELKVFEAAFAALKPGGVFGVVEHRTTANVTREEMAKSGYLTEAAVIEAAQKAGFRLEEKSEINANPKDTHDHPEGVWTLPPSYALGDKDHAKYAAIGESDRMTMRFRKPAR